MDDAKFLAFVAANKWTFAKSMPTIPHEWAVVQASPNKAEFNAAVLYLNTHGKPMRWRKTPVRMYYDADGWRYWTMDKDIKDVTLINRQRIEINEAVSVA